MEFGFLLDTERRLLSIGYRCDDGCLDGNCYDLLASEARLASFVAIAKNDVPATHWFRLGRAVTLAVFAQGDAAREAQEAGADFVGAEDLAKRVEEGFTDFDVAIATPDMMPIVGRLGRILGPSGKMPNPKVGTVTTDVRKAVEESKSGKVEYRTDRTAIVHLVIGKRSFEDRALLENYAAVIEEVIRAKPSVAKGRYLRSITIASTQGPGIKVDPTRTRDIVEEAPAVAA